MFTMNVAHGQRDGSDTRTLASPARAAVPTAPPAKTAANSRLSWPNNGAPFNRG